MDWILLLKGFVLGLVEGATEFLPISSTGHLIIVGDFLDFTDERAKVFDIAIQLGAILAVCWEYRERIARVATGLGSDPVAQRFALNLLVAFLPAMVFGLLLHRIIKDHLFNPFNVAVMLVAGGLFILWVEHLYNRKHHIETVDDMRWTDALKVGLAQSVAMVPGVSRSGATIMGGLIFGLSRKAATEFSFFLAIPTMFAATTYDVYKNRALLEWGDLPLFAVGFVTAFVAALIAVKSFLKFVSNHTFIGFAWYRILFGGVLLAYYY
jgi:undecaprenyl-diphosphatase